MGQQGAIVIMLGVGGRFLKRRNRYNKIDVLRAKWLSGRITGKETGYQETCSVLPYLQLISNRVSYLTGLRFLIYRMCIILPVLSWGLEWSYSELMNMQCFINWKRKRNVKLIFYYSSPKNICVLGGMKGQYLTLWRQFSSVQFYFLNREMHILGNFVLKNELRLSR